MKHLIPYLKKYKLQSIVAPLFKMLEACFDLAVPLIVQLVLNRTVLALCRGAAEMIGCEREGRLIGEMHGVVGTLLAAAAMGSLLFLLILALLIGMRSTGG